MNSRSSSPHHGGVNHLLHHLQLALVVASLISLMHAWGMLGWLDAAMLRLAASVQGASQDEQSVTTIPPDRAPVVLTISQSLYEGEFLQTSPLDRRKLASIIRTIPQGAERPATLVLDIDVSPMADAGGGEAQAKLDTALTELVHAGTRLVMTLPFRVKSPELVRQKAKWMHGMCTLNGTAETTTPPRVIFALGEALVNLGQAIQYDATRPTLGMVSSRPDDPAPHAHRICKALLAKDGPERWANSLLSASFSDEALSAVIGESSPHPSYRPFNPAYFPQVLAATEPLTALDALPSTLAIKPQSVAGKTVFLGGSFDRADQFDAPLTGGKVPGVLVHALVFASEARGIATFGGNHAYLLDIPIGLACAYLFQALWSWHRRVHAWSTRRGGLASYLGSKLSWALILGVLAAILIGCTALVVHRLYPAGHWLNPGPVMIGVAAKFLLSSIATHGEADSHGHPTEPRLHAWLNWAWVLVLVAFTVRTNLHH